MKVETDFTMAIIFFFFVLWLQSGWYRIDRALGQEKACHLIADEYEAKAKP